MDAYLERYRPRDKARLTCPFATCDSCFSGQSRRFDVGAPVRVFMRTRPALDRILLSSNANQGIFFG